MRLLRTALITCAVAAAVLVAQRTRFPRPPTLQERNMAMAEEHVPVVQSALGKDPRFAAVKLGVYTGREGCLWVLGHVRSEEDKAALERAVESTNTPVPVHWTVNVYPEQGPPGGG
jgi:hypothetical protein